MNGCEELHAFSIGAVVQAAAHFQLRSLGGDKGSFRAADRDPAVQLSRLVRRDPDEVDIIAEAGKVFPLIGNAFYLVGTAGNGIVQGKLSLVMVEGYAVAGGGCGRTVVAGGFLAVDGRGRTVVEFQVQIPQGLVATERHVPGAFARTDEKLIDQFLRLIIFSLQDYFTDTTELFITLLI